MAYQKTYRTIVPVENGGDHDVARWLARESFEQKAASEGLELVDYTEREVPAADARRLLIEAHLHRGEVPPLMITMMGRPVEDFAWYEFSGTGQLNQDVFDWLSAECMWRNDQISEWLTAETAWRNGQINDWLNSERRAEGEHAQSV